MQHVSTYNFLRDAFTHDEKHDYGFLSRAKHSSCPVVVGQR